MTKITMTDGITVESSRVTKIESTEHQNVVQLTLDDGSLHFSFVHGNIPLHALVESWPHIGRQDARHDATEYLRRDALVAGANEAHRRAVEAGKRLARTKRPAKWMLKAVAAIAECTGPLSSDLAEYRDIVGKKTET